MSKGEQLLYLPLKMSQIVSESCHLFDIPISMFMFFISHKILFYHINTDTINKVM